MKVYRESKDRELANIIETNKDKGYIVLQRGNEYKLVGMYNSSTYALGTKDDINKAITIYFK